MPVPPVIPIGMTVIRVSAITVVVDMQAIRMPTDRECRRHAPEETTVEVVAGRIRIVINRVSMWMVVISRTRLVNHDARRFVVRNLNYVFRDRCDLNVAFIVRNGLIGVTL